VRIVAGSLKGRRLEAPHGRNVRPTSDRVREAIFNILEHGLGIDLTDLCVVDVFAGTGALGLEALSRGAKSAVFVDVAKESLDCLRANIATLGVEGATKVIRADASRLAGPPAGVDSAGLVFLDPPYAADLVLPALSRLIEKDWLVPDALCVVELSADTEIAWPETLTVVEDRRYGDTRVVFLRYRSRM